MSTFDKKKKNLTALPLFPQMGQTLMPTNCPPADSGVSHSRPQSSSAMCTTWQGRQRSPSSKGGRGVPCYVVNMAIIALPSFHPKRTFPLCLPGASHVWPPSWLDQGSVSAERATNPYSVYCSLWCERWVGHNSLSWWFELIDIESFCQWRAQWEGPMPWRCRVGSRQAETHSDGRVEGQTFEEAEPFVSQTEGAALLIMLTMKP